MHSIDWEIAGVTIFYHHATRAATHCLWRDPPFNFSSSAGHQKWIVSGTQPLPQQSTLSNWKTWSPVLRRGTPLNMPSIQTVLGTRSGLSGTQPLLQQSTASNWSTWTSVWWRVTPLNMPSTQAGWSSQKQEWLYTLMNMSVQSHIYQHTFHNTMINLHTPCFSLPKFTSKFQKILILSHNHLCDELDEFVSIGLCTCSF